MDTIALRHAKTSVDIDRVIEDRIRGLSVWLDENEPEMDRQAHLDEGSSERAYWHLGYLTALRDIRDLLTGRRKALN